MMTPTNNNNFGPRLYFAYGSNLHRAQMMRRCRSAEPVRRFGFKHWKLVFRGVADIMPCRDEVVHGALYRVTAADVAALDRYEGIAGGLYRQVNFRITQTGERGFFYGMNETGLYPPEPAYYAIIKAGFRDWNIPLGTLRHAYSASDGRMS